ncbi:MAG: type VI secretion system contractile sheath small subunit, partial [Desulfovibrionaceae bacterium]|nr:type VI secretion system contractile sheath small subunit [Desulfovibrionaceae bacterium]
MAKEGSIAPKERVNIVYRPATGDVQEDVELPLKVMVMGDFLQREDDRPIEDRDPVSIDKDNFNDVMKGQQLSLQFNVPNTLSDDPEAQMPVQLAFEKMDDFSPDAVAAQVPELAKLLALREALKALKG